MDIRNEVGRCETGCIKHKTLSGEVFTRAVRWYPISRRAYRWSVRGDRWIELGRAWSLYAARGLAAKDLYVMHSLSNEIAPRKFGP